ncbi:unnamed protein product [Prunus armeniaca]|uniref:Uncharacterized protein n=1 Tax=Prunus armeniaca TaxID=36596 RepID=A0A6J5WM34_PRUAR|nr:hypothetical protein GBA52_009361 [Prunus armeniaca]CAB4302609.1 unnamed protein product [Prunus armeniaca]
MAVTNGSLQQTHHQPNPAFQYLFQPYSLPEPKTRSRASRVPLPLITDNYIMGRGPRYKA